MPKRFRAVVRLPGREIIALNDTTTGVVYRILRTRYRLGDIVITGIWDSEVFKTTNPHATKVIAPVDSAELDQIKRGYEDQYRGKALKYARGIWHRVHED